MSDAQKAPREDRPGTQQGADVSWDEQPVIVPTGTLVRAYGALSAAAHHLRNLPASKEFDDIRVAELCERAFNAITEATDFESCAGGPRAPGGRGSYGPAAPTSSRTP